MRKCKAAFMMLFSHQIFFLKTTLTWSGAEEQHLSRLRNSPSATWTFRINSKWPIRFPKCELILVAWTQKCWHVDFNNHLLWIATLALWVNKVSSSCNQKLCMCWTVRAYQSVCVAGLRHVSGSLHRAIGWFYPNTGLRWQVRSWPSCSALRNHWAARSGNPSYYHWWQSPTCRTVALSLQPEQEHLRLSQFNPLRSKTRGSLTCHRDLRAAGCVGSPFPRWYSAVENFLLCPALIIREICFFLFHLILTALQPFQIWCNRKRGAEAELAWFIWLQSYNLRGFNQHPCRLKHKAQRCISNLMIFQYTKEFPRSLVPGVYYTHTHTEFLEILDILNQGCQTYGPRAGSSPPGGLVRPRG